MNLNEHLLYDGLLVPVSGRGSQLDGPTESWIQLWHQPWTCKAGCFQSSTDNLAPISIPVSN